MQGSSGQALGAETGRSPLAELLFMAVPTIAQMASYTAMQFLDVWMLTQPGVAKDAATAAANAGILSFSVVSLGFGTLFIVNTLASQAYGRKDYSECGRYLWQGIWFALLYSVPFLPLCFVTLGLFGWWHEPHLARMEDTFLRITLASTFPKLVGVAANQYLLATNRPNTIFVGTGVGMLANALAAYVLIFGKLGFPAMGVEGSAYAMIVGILVETGTFLAFALGPRESRVKFNALDWRLRPAELMQLVRVGFPSGVQVLADVLAWFMFCAWVMGQFGNDAMAANVIMFRYLSVSFMPAFGLAQAVTALVGRYIGAGRPDVAEDRARLGLQVTMCYGMVCVLMYTMFREPLIRFFHPSDEVLKIGMTLLILAAVYQLWDIVYIVYLGALRGAGDTFVPAVATATLCWGITVLGGYLTARWLPGAGPLGPWVTASVYGSVLGGFMYLRWRRGGWKTIHLDPPAASAKLADLTLLTDPAR